jgi:hypothetical protein
VSIITVQCPKGHFIATVNVTDDGIIPRGTRHGLVWDYAPTQDITRVHARCLSRHCTYDGSLDYRTLCAELAAATARGDTKHRLIN